VVDGAILDDKAEGPAPAAKPDAAALAEQALARPLGIPASGLALATNWNANSCSERVLELSDETDLTINFSLSPDKLRDTGEPATTSSGGCRGSSSGGHHQTGIGRFRPAFSTWGCHRRHRKGPRSLWRLLE
jgi:hypothetical protein